MRKKLLTVALAATMVVSSVFSAFAETLTGTAWWTGVQTGSDYTLEGDGSISLDIAFESTTDETGYGAFNVEVYNTAWYFTTGSDVNAWYAEDALNQGETITGVASTPESTIVAGTTYTVTVTRSGSTITVTYLNPDGSTYAELVGTNDSTPDTLKIHVMAQVGTYEVTESTGSSSDSDDDEEETTTVAATDSDDEEETTTASTTSPDTADTAAVAVIAVVALGAAVAVVASKKKVTE